MRRRARVSRFVRSFSSRQGGKHSGGIKAGSSRGCAGSWTRAGRSSGTPIRGPVQESPLAVCDAQSIRQDDFVASDLIYPHRRGETYAVTYNPTHRWYYFPDMQPDEALLLKCYDSAAGRARFTAHTAFDDPTSPPDAAPRESIEIRAFVFFTPGR